MKLKRSISILAILFLVTGLLWACQAEAPAPATTPEPTSEPTPESAVDEFAVLVDYLESNSLDYPNQGGAWIFAHDVELEKYFIIDIRSAEDFAKENKKFEILGGAMGENALDRAGVEAVSKMPSREELIATIVGMIGAPASNIAGAIGAPASNIASILSTIEDRAAA